MYYHKELRVTNEQFQAREVLLHARPAFYRARENSEFSNIFQFENLNSNRKMPKTASSLCCAV
jgi:hypothetical protein